MYTLITVFLAITCLLLGLVVLVQNSKGGGLAAGFSASNQVMGVRRTTDLLEKLTWGLAIALMIFSVAGTMFQPRQEETVASSAIQEQIDNAALPSGAMPVPGADQQDNNAAQSPEQTPAENAPGN